MKWKELTVDIIAALYIVLFLYAALSKLSDYEKFRVQLGQSPLLTSTSEFMAWLIPLTEILLAVMLAVERLRLAALYASYTLMVVFTAYIINILNFSEFIPCSCGGLLENMGWREHLIFNLIFTLLSIIGVLLEINLINTKYLKHSL